MRINIKPDDLVYPYFVVSGSRRKEKIKLFPQVYRFSIDRLLEEIKTTVSLGVNKILLFGVPAEKDALGTQSYAEDNLISQAVSKIKEEFKRLTIITDVCLCAYTTHGHCGIIEAQSAKAGKAQNEFNIDNARTLKILSRIALSHAQAGADWVAPSAMAKGQVRAIRAALDHYGFPQTKILGYSAKFASNFYGPFREAAGSSPRFADRSSYQLDYQDTKAALKEIRQDIQEGADMVMVKPALSYLDIIKAARDKFHYPLSAYNVSAEYSLVKYGAKQGLWDEKKIALEIISSIKRAGADWIISYHAKDIVKWLKKEKQ